MIKLRQNNYFKMAAIILGACFAFFAFHALLHLDHAFEEGHHQCSVCQVLAFFALLTIFAYCLQIFLGSTRSFSKYSFSLCQNLSLSLLAARAPPLFS